jgi:hypothetical protein
MRNSVLAQIESSFGQLSVSEQLLLIERLVHQVHEVTLKRRGELDQQLAMMAADPEIQRELQRIELEFSNAEADGLES